MTEPLTDQQLDEIEQRATSEHLTPGPWDLAYEACDCGGDYPCGHGPYVTGVITPVPTSIAADRCKRTGEEPRDYDFHRGEVGDFTEADWVLMVAAREDVPALLDEIRRQRAVLSTLADRWQHLADHGDAAIGHFEGPAAATLDAEVGERGRTYRQAADDVREVLATGRIPHDLMTDADEAATAAGPGARPAGASA